MSCVVWETLGTHWRGLFSRWWKARSFIQDSTSSHYHCTLTPAACCTFPLPLLTSFDDDLRSSLKKNYSFTHCLRPRVFICLLPTKCLIAPRSVISRINRVESRAAVNYCQHLVMGNNVSGISTLQRGQQRGFQRLQNSQKGQ